MSLLEKCPRQHPGQRHFNDMAKGEGPVVGKKGVRTVAVPGSQVGTGFKLQCNRVKRKPQRSDLIGWSLYAADSNIVGVPPT